MENGMAKVRDSSSDRQTELVVCAGRSFHGVKITPAMQHGDGAIVYIYHPLIPHRLSVEPESEALTPRSSTQGKERLRMQARQANKKDEARHCEIKKTSYHCRGGDTRA